MEIEKKKVPTCSMAQTKDPQLGESSLTETRIKTDGPVIAVHYLQKKERESDLDCFGLCSLPKRLTDALCQKLRVMFKSEVRGKQTNCGNASKEEKDERIGRKKREAQKERNRIGREQQ